MILSIILGVLGSMGVGGLLKVWLDHQRGVRKQTDDMAISIVKAMTARLVNAERHGILCEANLAAMRHSKNNLAGAFDSFLMLIKTSPEKIGDIILHVEEMRRDHIKSEALERAEILRAALAAIDEPMPEEHTAA